MPNDHVSYDRHIPAVVIRELAISEPAVLAESRRWSTGRRGAAVGEDEMTGVDLTPFATQAFIVGAHAIGAAGGAQDTFSLERLVSDVGARTAESAEKAVQATTDVVGRAAEAMQKAASEAQTAIAEAGMQTRQSFTDSVEGARKGLLDEVQRIFGGDNPELTTRLSPLLEKFGHDLDARVTAQTGELIAKAGRQFDPDDPTSPIAKHSRELQRHQQTLSVTLATNHKELAAKVDTLATAVQVATASRQATANAAKVTPLQGATFDRDPPGHGADRDWAWRRVRRYRQHRRIPAS